jgi:hypothetical protein
MQIHKKLLDETVKALKYSIEHLGDVQGHPTARSTSKVLNDLKAATIPNEEEAYIAGFKAGLGDRAREFTPTQIEGNAKAHYEEWRKKKE